MLDLANLRKQIIRISALVLLGVAPWPAIADDPNDVATFQERFGSWVIVGDARAGGCFAWQTEASGTKLTIAALPAQETIRFALSNPVWRSLTDNDSMRIAATFQSRNGRISDYWNLASVGTSEAKGGPRIHFDIWRAKNDGASFIEQFQRASSIGFWRGTVPVATFSLNGSNAMMESLIRCRTSLQLDKEFDPFAN